MIDIKFLLKTTIERDASDLHIIPGFYPSLRVNNDLFPLQISEIVTPQNVEQIIFPLLSEEQKQNLLGNKEIDIGYEFEGHRFRINIYYAKNAICAAFRLIPARIKTIEELSLPPVFHEFSKFNQGLVLVTGPTGEGKSSTLATIINEINVDSAKHIVTIEDPIEFVYPQGKSIISQRELHQDTHSWMMALKSVLREDPDIVLLGEMRDYDTIQAAITVAETGHLVFSTLHTNSTPEAINRIIDVFPPQQQAQIRNQLAAVLRVVIAQRLLPDIENKGRVPAVEILINTQAVSSIIREGKTFMLDTILETEERENMILFEKYLTRLYQGKRISKETALKAAFRASEIKKLIP